MITIWKKTVSQLLTHHLGEKQREKKSPNPERKTWADDVRNLSNPRRLSWGFLLFVLLFSSPHANQYLLFLAQKPSLNFYVPK